MSITIGIVDDDRIFVHALFALLDQDPPLQPILAAVSGEELLHKLATMPTHPDILLIDVNMQPMDGPATAKIIHEKYPLIRMAALSTTDDDGTIVQMIRAGCCAYLLKEVGPDELKRALLEIHEYGHYNGDAININHRRSVRFDDSDTPLSSKETQFVKLACSELTYKQIAAIMHLSERTIDGYRESVFQKLNVQCRVGMVLEAIRRRIFFL